MKHLLPSVLASISLSLSAHAADPIPIITIGDSISAGTNFGSVVTYPWPAFASTYPEFSSIPLTNFSIGGATAALWLSLQIPIPPSITSFWAIIALGANDALAGSTYTTYAINMLALRDRLISLGATRVIFLLQPDYDMYSPYSQTRALFNTVMSLLCGYGEGDCIDTSHMPIHPYHLITDGIINPHPVQSGQIWLADEIYSQLLLLLP